MTTPQLQTLFRFLISKANNMQLVVASEVKSIFNVNDQMLHQSLEIIHAHCRDSGIPLFSSIVIDEKLEQPIICDCSEDAFICTLRASMSDMLPHEYPQP